jgi:hypothetical protein
LLLQWQIQAALLEEAKSGMTLIGSTRDDYLPFSKTQIDQQLDQFLWQETQIRDAGKVAHRQWIIQLIVRAWKFGEATLPKTFEFKTRNMGSAGMHGDLPYFGGLSAIMPYPPWLRSEDIKEQDVFEVELERLDAYEGEIQVKGLRRLSPSSKIEA